MRLLIADDHSILRQSIALLLSKESDLEVVGQAGDGGQTMDLVECLKPDIVLMDIAMPRLNGIEATRRIRKKHPEVKVLILSMHSEDRYIRQLLRAGASGYMLKDASKKELVTAIRSVVQGESYLSPAVTRKLIDDYVRITDEITDSSTYHRLTNREREIFQLMTENRLNREIGVVLKISPKTVKNHRAKIMEKLNLHSQRDVLKYARNMDLIDFEAL
ncbi:MAG: response regulator transcription factor [Deltaproteobacteria bacterium]|nr:response regulator transcription factor [Deltaproteobacteria bacterium]MBW2053496.1 response regulator transcription factor [Deltaproteobacteria bacterium]MBW2141998.1 response regulator transcription factor [Deltaproteobacteria bacterium]MBW2323935.1 response regulator transcription factor [Deltaproteobacteria bacterium]